MKGLKKVLSLIMGLLLALSVGTVAKAAPDVMDTTVIIHKIVVPSIISPQEHDGYEITDIIAKFGQNAKEITDGVEFTAWQVPAGTTIIEGKTDEYYIALSKAMGVSPIQNIPAGGDGTTFHPGTYYVKETKRPDIVKEDGIGVPFIMELPVLNKDNTDYLDVLHLYPKNVVEDYTPVIDKDVVSKGIDNATFDVGEEFAYLIYPNVPKGIEDYTIFEISDKFDTAITYKDNIVVTYKDGVKSANDVTFVEGTDDTADYKVSEELSGTRVVKLTIAFTEKGLDKLAANRFTSDGKARYLEISFKAMINTNAPMDTPIYNNAVLTYNNGYVTNKDEDGNIINPTADVPELSQPEVHTGERKFIKIDNVTKGNIPVLNTATFVVKNGDGKYMVNENGIISWVSGAYNKNTDGTLTWTGTIAEAPEPTEVRILLNDGKFEVRGLAYGTYTLDEIDVPSGYIRMEPHPFTVGEKKDGQLVTSTINVINVKRPDIPDTGGIGTIIFLAGGLLIMGAAVLALKKKRTA